MNIYDIAKKVFSLNEHYGEFELLETESGVPGEENPKTAQQESAPGMDTVAAQCKTDRMSTLCQDFDVNVNAFCYALNLPDNKDVIMRKFNVYGAKRACIFYMSGMADADRINDFILRQSMCQQSFNEQEITMQYFCQNVASIAEHSIKKLVIDAVYDVLSGMTMVILEGSTEIAIFETRGFATRSVEQPKIEKVIRGPHESYVEAIRTNITLIRKIIKTSDLVFDFVQMGGNNNLVCAIAYRKGFTNPKLISEVKEKIAKVKTNYILGEGMLEQFSQRRKYSIISQTLITERPDRTASLIMEGHIAVLCDGSPYAQVVPITFGTLMSSPDDAYMRSSFVSISRISRSIGLFICAFLPAIYVALVKYHQSIISTELIGTILVARRNVSMPVEIELLLLLLIFQLVRESGLRVPGEMGQSLSVISALVLGQASVSANLTSAIMLIVVAVVGLGNYSIPDMSLQIATNVFQLILIGAASLCGFYGIGLATAATTAYLFQVKSYGVPMFAPFSPKARMSYSFFSRGNQQISVEPEDIMNPLKSK